MARTFARSVRAAQAHYGCQRRALNSSLTEAGRQEWLTEEEVAFIEVRDGFYLDAFGKDG